MQHNDYDRSLHITYASGRAFAPRMEKFWEEALATHVRRGDRYFRAAKTIDDQRLPGAARLDGAFERAGFEVTFRDRVFQIVDDDLAAHRDRLWTRAISTFELLSEVEIESGIAAMDAAVAAGADHGRIRDSIELVVYRRRDDDEHSDPSI